MSTDNRIVIYGLRSQQPTMNSVLFSLFHNYERTLEGRYFDQRTLHFFNMDNTTYLQGIAAFCVKAIGSPCKALVLGEGIIELPEDRLAEWAMKKCTEDWPEKTWHRRLCQDLYQQVFIEGNSPIEYRLIK